MIQTVYHGTDLKSLNAILKTKKLCGDPPLFGPGLCTTFGRALNFVCIKAGRQTRRVGRVLALEVDSSVMEGATRDTVADAFTLPHTVRALSLEDPRVISYRVLLPREWDKMIMMERRKR